MLRRHGSPHDSDHTSAIYPVTLYEGPVQNVGKDPRTMKHITLADLYHGVRAGDWANEIAYVRSFAIHKSARGPDGKKTPEALEYDYAKERLPFAVPSGHYVPGHRHGPEPQNGRHAAKFPECAQGGAYPPEPSGIRFVELDNLNGEELAAETARLRTYQSVVALWRSPGGSGLHIFVLVDPKPMNSDAAHAAHAIVSTTLGIAETGDKSVKNLARIVFVSHDPDAWWNPAPVPLAYAMPANSNGEQGLPETLTEPAGIPERLAEAMNVIPPPSGEGDYNHWLGWVTRFKAAGFSEEAVDAWSRRGARYNEGEVVKRWASLPAHESAEEAADIIIGHAVKYCGLRPDRGKGRSYPSTKAKCNNADRNDNRNVLRPAPANLSFPAPRWYEIGWWVAQRVLHPEIFYDPEVLKATFWQWCDNRWRMVPKNSPYITDILHQHQFKLAHELREHDAEMAASMVGNVRYWQDQCRQDKSPFNAGLRHSLSRHLEIPPQYVIAAANGVLDLRSGAMTPHTPTGPYLITAVTSGRFLPDDLDALRPEIEARLSPAIPITARRERLYKGLAVCFGGKAGTNIRGSLIYLYGKDGGGKGNTSRVIGDAFGHYCMTGNVKSLNANSDIQDSLATMLERMPRLIAFHEVGSLPMEKILSITGRDPQSARSPYKPTIERTLTTGVLVTAVHVPKGRMDTGARRRLLGLSFDQKADVTIAKAREDTTQEERDAFVTVVLHDAITMWRDPAVWQPLPDDDDDTIQARHAADVVAEFVDSLTDAHVGRSVKSLLQELRELRGYETDRMNERSLSTRINKQPEWTVARRRWQGDSKVARIFRPDADEKSP